MCPFTYTVPEKRSDNQRRHLTSIHKLTNLNVREVKRHFRPFFEEGETPAPSKSQIKSKAIIPPQKVDVNNKESSNIKDNTDNPFELDIPSSITFDDFLPEETLPDTLNEFLEGDSDIKTHEPLKHSPRKTFNQLPDPRLDCSFKQPKSIEPLTYTKSLAVMEPPTEVDTYSTQTKLYSTPVLNSPPKCSGNPK